jgi:hypothetical protein
MKRSEIFLEYFCFIFDIKHDKCSLKELGRNTYGHTGRRMEQIRLFCTSFKEPNPLGPSPETDTYLSIEPNQVCVI